MKFDRDKAKADAAFFKALAHPSRVWMVRQLAQRDHCVREFVEALGVQFATVSRHLSVLRKAGVVFSKKHGREIFYYLDHDAAQRFDKIFRSK